AGRRGSRSTARFGAGKSERALREVVGVFILAFKRPFAAEFKGVIAMRPRYNVAHNLTAITNGEPLQRTSGGNSRDRNRRDGVAIVFREDFGNIRIPIIRTSSTAYQLRANEVLREVIAYFVDHVG